MELPALLKGQQVFAKETGLFARVGVDGPVPMALAGPKFGVRKCRFEAAFPVAFDGPSDMVKVQMGQQYVRDVRSGKPACSQRFVEGVIAVQVVVAEEFFRLLGANSCVDEQQVFSVFNEQAAHGPRTQIIRICLDVPGPQ